jgi:SpoVK/Ycf46/Vps4 family AAA+-type ATPase
VVRAEVPGPHKTRSVQNSLDHIQAELKLIALKLHLWVRNQRRNSPSDEAAGFQGLYISDKEIDDLLSVPGVLLCGNNFQPGHDLSKAEEQQIKQVEETILTCGEDARSRGLKLRLDILKNFHNLSRLEIDTILLCLLAEIDIRYQKLYAYLQDDITKKAPTIDLVLRFLCRTTEESFRTREYFLPEAPLVKYKLINMQEDRVSGSTSFLGKSIHLDERITGFLSGQDRIDSRLAPFVSLVSPQTRLEDLAVAGEIKQRLPVLISNHKKDALICCLSGVHGPLKRDIAEAICCGLDTPMLAVNVKALVSSETPADTLISLIFREGYLQDAALYLDDFDSVVEEKKEKEQLSNKIVPEIGSYSNWIILGLEKDRQPENIVTSKPCVNLRLSVPAYSERLQTWEKLLREKQNLAEDIDIADLAGKFKFHDGQISQALNMARSLANWRDPERGLVTGEDLYAACRKQSGETLNALALKVRPCYGWEDIILPKDQMEQLHEICSYLEHYHTVYDVWGFGRKLSLGKGLKALFAGPSGTGKTMAAEVIAGELKIDLYKIDLSTIVSKYIGETEKNLDKIFHEGQTSNAILFFDEADALFGKRSEVRDAHDRYANIETAYLLQKMDEYEGSVILATNLRKNMDEAFARRLHFALEFPLPEEPDRCRIWQRVFPRESPLHPEINFPFLARQFKISGGNIKNIALGAAFLAASNGGLITMEHLVKATKREYQKIGKLCTEGDFGEYFDLVKS